MKTFIDLFAGIGGTRSAFENIGAECVFSSEWDRFAQQTYAANFGETPAGDIRAIDAADIPDHDVLLAGFPCQPFSIAGVSKKNSLGHAHGFADDKQGNLFFEITRILKEKRPSAFLLENVRNLRTHDRGRTFKIIHESLQQLDYNISYQVLDAQSVVPQHRERIFIVGFSRDVWPDLSFTFPEPSTNGKPIGEILQSVVDDKYTLSDHLWDYLQAYAEKHRRRGNGFGYGLVDPARDSITRTLSARYYKDGSEILIKQEDRNPRRLTPRECARLMGFPDEFIIPVSDTQAYRQFGNSVVVPLVEQVAHTMMDWQETSTSISALAAAYAEQLRGMRVVSDHFAFRRQHADISMKAAIEATRAIIGSAYNSPNDLLDQMNLVTGNLASLLRNTPQPFSALELSSLFVQTANQVDVNILKNSLANLGLNGTLRSREKSSNENSLTIAVDKSD